MTTEEFSNEFDVLLNSYSRTLAFGNTTNIVELDEYEKSVFLTKAQEDIIIEIYNGKNPTNDSFEKTEETRRYLNELIKTYETSDKFVDMVGISSNSIFFWIPEDVWFITYESVILQDDNLKCINGNNALVTPITQDEFYKINKNPFRGASKNRVLRLDISNNSVELVSNYNIDKYIIRYLSKPSPIILTTLDSDLNINEVNEETPCKLNTSIHRRILERAVRLAIISKTQLSANK